MGFFDKFKKTFTGGDKDTGGSKEEAKEVKEDLNKGLEKSSRNIFDRISKAVAGKSQVDINILDDIEEALISSDVSLDTTIKIIDRLEARVAKDKYVNSNDVYVMVKEEMVQLLEENNVPDADWFDVPDLGPNKPYVLLVVGVNGVGKTTSIGKISNRLKWRGKEVILGAADTFRAAAIEQLEVWAKRVDIPIVKKEQGSDPAAVAYETVEKAVEGNFDVAIIDTAGRLHNKVNLMKELSKIRRVVQKVIPDGPHEVMLVLDGSTGQNAIEQAKQFMAATEVTSLTVTKLDGTAKGGVVIAIADQFKIPIKFIGVGEKLQHLQVFNKAEFVDSLFQ